MILTKEECDALGRRVLGLTTAREAQVRIDSQVTASTNFARGDAHVASENTTVEVNLEVQSPDGMRCEATTNRLDDAGLKVLVAEAEAAGRVQRAPRQPERMLEPQQYRTPPKLFFESVPGAMRADTRAAVFRAAIDATEGAGLVGAGDAAFELRARAIMNTAGLSAYTSGTYAEFSLTARTKNGLGSGWAWSGYEDWSRVNAATVVASAVDLAQRSADPVGIEPGRYTVILEPAAVAALIEGILQWWDARFADGGATIYAKDPLGTNKIGLQMMDQRLWLVADPWDPDKPTSPIGRYGESYTKVVWFERGVLQNLEYDPYYAKAKGRETVLDPGGARLYAEGPTQSLEEMIASTRRGLWVSRLSGVFLMNLRTMLFTGTTRDGTFLIENGKITKAVKNFRFTESPFFVFNKLDAAGDPVRASRLVVAPRLKVRDFDFTSLTDAI